MRTLKLYGAPVARRVRFSPVELREHFSSIGKDTNEVNSAVWGAMEPVLSADSTLDNVPDEEEILRNLDQMRESAPGPDGVTVQMLRQGGEILRRKVVGLVQIMWAQDPSSWELVVHDAEVVALHKKGDRTKLDNYRGICLLQVLSRLIARIAGRRLSEHLEKHSVLATEQWGFRPYRSAVDALFVMSRLVADAGGTVDFGYDGYPQGISQLFKERYGSGPRSRRDSAAAPSLALRFGFRHAVSMSILHGPFRPIPDISRNS
jgi:hypothetical protein